jgi:hypothetical protein
MRPWFDISVNVHRDLLKITVGGFFNAEDVKRFAAARARAHDYLRSAPNAHLALVDTSACNIQRQEVLAQFGQVMIDSRYRPRQMAFVASGPIALMQVCRLTSKMPGVRIFEDVDMAIAWLLVPALSRAA